MNEADERDSDLSRLLAIWSEKKKKFGLTQELAAKEFGFKNASAISQYLTGHIPLNPTINKKFADFLGVSLESISPSTANFFNAKKSDKTALLPALTDFPSDYEIVNVDNKYTEAGFDSYFAVIDPKSKSIDTGVFAVRVGDGIRLLAFSRQGEFWRVLGASNSDEVISMTEQHVSLLQCVGKVIYKLSKAL